MSNKVYIAVRALAAALLGAQFASLWTRGARLWLVGAVILLVLLGVLFLAAGRMMLRFDPVHGLALLEVSLLAPLMAAVVGAAIIIRLADHPAPSAEAPNYTPPLIAFLGVLLIDWLADKDDKIMSDIIRKAFYSKFKLTDDGRISGEVVYFRKSSDGARWVYGDGHISGWEWSARRKRAKLIGKEMRSGNSY